MRHKIPCSQNFHLLLAAEMKNEPLHISLSHSEGEFFKPNPIIICVLGEGF